MFKVKKNHGSWSVRIKVMIPILEIADAHIATLILKQYIVQP